METDIDIAARLVVQLLRAEKMHVSTAESCTGGMLSAAVTSVSGSSEVFDLGMCTYACSAKKEMLGVSAESLEKYGAVSEQVATEMAQGIMRVSKSDIAVSVTGLAGPTGAESGKPVGTVFIGIASRRGAFAKRNLFSLREGENDIRRSVREQTVLTALKLVEAEISACRVYERN